ncbi:MAG: purine-nucleoside phosphorylase [Actinobacteria bacterium]|nr:purine-nucleoside phosphorylase [Actinomycetota bacterium]
MNASGPPSPGGDQVERGAELIRQRAGPVAAGIGVILGSGLGDAVGSDLRADVTFRFDELPGFPPPAVPGHAGTLSLGELYGVPVVVMSGRIHFYEEHPMSVVTLPTRLLHALGVTRLIVTNASGGTDPSMPLGLLILIRDHINFMGANPLMGWRYPDGAPAFVDVSSVWDPALRAILADAAREEGVEVREGVYAAVSGPSYETAAETAMLARLGADAIGMSTVPEAVAAAALGMKCVGISCVTDVAGTELTHDDVVAVASEAAPNLRRLLSRAIPRIGAA